MKVYDMTLDDIEAKGIFAISLVEEPAIEEEFIALSKEQGAERLELSVVDADKRLLIGAVLVPDKPIVRLGKDGKPYYIRFSKEVIQKAREKYMEKGYLSSVTLQHKSKVEGVTTVELWIVEDEQHDKSRVYGLDYPVGSLVVMMKVNNDQIWNEEVKEGKVKGFSIEGEFAHELVMSSKYNLSQEEVDEAMQFVSDLRELANEIESKVYEKAE